MEGPAGGRPCMRICEVLPPRRKLTMMSRTWAWRMEGAWKYSPAAAVPVSTKIPEPITAPMPNAVSDHGPRVPWMVVTSGCGLLQNPALSHSLLAIGQSLRRFATERASRPLPHESLLLPLRLAAGQLLYFGLFRSASIVAGLERLFRLALLAGGAAGFLAFFLAE